ncbi:hypothetical protein H2199_007810 [Coniosporium tulheliwenetii]|uniref:Uncharacterized protein n=1 Tax=Coniosporium tulheliwenetii TaxID=3383036 RepID=A0ACC2YNY3_9PEZI|nr:hypothetical protein H2199_007810 [Cladosporium sp. JES 115]
MFFLLVLLFLLSLTDDALAVASPPTVHFTLSRRGGPFPTSGIANLTFLSEELAKAEASFNQTRRAISGNKVVRVAKAHDVGGGDNGRLLGDVGGNGSWFATLELGDPAQHVEMDISMLTSDFFVRSTSSPLGSHFHDIFSKSYRKSNQRPFPSCILATEEILLPTLKKKTPLPFPHCRPSKYSSATLGASGSLLGLAPSKSLSQIKRPSLIEQLLEANIIEENVWSLLFINGHEGVLSVGGTAAEAVQAAEDQVKLQLDRLGQLEHDGATEGYDAPPEEDSSVLHRLAKRGGENDKDSSDTWRSGWKWIKVEGAAGWWQILMRGVWVNGIKILKNQPVILDITTPLILAPPLAARTLYASIPGSLHLPAPHHNFHAFPCLNPPQLHFELAGWNFPVLRGAKDTSADNETPWTTESGGPLSLGRLEDGSGYCLGAVVESWMGVGDSGMVGGGREGGGDRGVLAGNGLRDVWVLGQPAFGGWGLC